MAYLWYRTDAAESGHSPTRRTHPWGVEYDNGDRYYVRDVQGNGRYTTRYNGRELGLPVDHVLEFQDAVLVDPIIAKR